MQIALERNVPHLACVSRVFAPLIGKVMDDKTFPINEYEHPTHTPSSNVLYVSHLGVQTLHLPHKKSRRANKKGW